MDQLHEDSDFAHIVWVPCDSHGLQLLLKDVLRSGKDRRSIGDLPTTFAEVQTIAKFELPHLRGPRGAIFSYLVCRAM